MLHPETLTANTIAVTTLKARTTLREPN